MTIVQAQIALWDKIYNLAGSDDVNVAPADLIIIKTDYGLELAKVVNVFVANDDYQVDESVYIIRQASVSDLEKAPSMEERQAAIDYCRGLIHQHNLDMKLVDANFAFDGSRLTFAFVADGRVDFRDLVKELTRYFNKNIRLQQIGIRDEAKLLGDHGKCGRGLCCRGFLTSFSSITSEMADIQNIAHRGSDRISGACGRLMCCLSYEVEGYKEKLAKMPPIGSRVNVDGKFGVVLGHHVLKESVDVRFESGKNGEPGIIAEVDLNRHKK